MDSRTMRKGSYSPKITCQSGAKSKFLFLWQNISQNTPKKVSHKRPMTGINIIYELTEKKSRAGHLMYTFWALWRHKTDFDGHLTKRHQLVHGTAPRKPSGGVPETEDLHFVELRGKGSKGEVRHISYFIYYLERVCCINQKRNEYDITTPKSCDQTQMELEKVVVVFGDQGTGSGDVEEDRSGRRNRSHRSCPMQPAKHPNCRATSQPAYQTNSK